MELKARKGTFISYICIGITSAHALPYVKLSFFLTSF